MKVYAVMHGSIYEGGDLHSVHAGRESALATVAALLAEEADELAAYRAGMIGGAIRALSSAR